MVIANDDSKMPCGCDKEYYKKSCSVGLFDKRREDFKLLKEADSERMVNTESITITNIEGISNEFIVGWEKLGRDKRIFRTTVIPECCCGEGIDSECTLYALELMLCAITDCLVLCRDRLGVVMVRYQGGRSIIAEQNKGVGYFCVEVSGAKSKLKLIPELLTDSIKSQGVFGVRLT